MSRHLTPIMLPEKNSNAQSWYSQDVTFAVASGPPESLKIELDGETHFFITSITYEATVNDFRVTFKKNSDAYSNLPVHALNVLGTGVLPFYLNRPIILAPRTPFFIEVSNGATAINTIRFTVGGVKVGNPEDAERYSRKLTGHDLAPRQIEFFQYVLNGTYAANERRPSAMSILGDRDFVAESLTENSTGDWQGSLQTMGVSRGQWHDALIRKSMWTGTAQYPYILQPRMLMRNSKLIADIQDLSGAPNVIQIAFNGFKSPDLTPNRGPR